MNRLKGMMKRIGVAVMVMALVFGMTPIYTTPVAKADEDLSNKYIDETMPWKLAKDETQRQALANVLYNLTEALRIVAILISPFMPVTAQKIFNQLNVTAEFKLSDAETFGLLEANHEVGKPEQLFPRIEVNK